MSVRGHEHTKTKRVCKGCAAERQTDVVFLSERRGLPSRTCHIPAMRIACDVLRILLCCCEPNAMAPLRSNQGFIILITRRTYRCQRPKSGTENTDNKQSDCVTWASHLRQLSGFGLLFQSERCKEAELFDQT